MPHSSSCDASSPPLLQNPPHLTHSTNRFHCCLSSKMRKMSENHFVPFLLLSFAPSRPVFELSPSSVALSNAPPSLSVSESVFPHSSASCCSPLPSVHLSAHLSSSTHPSLFPPAELSWPQLSPSQVPSS